MCLSSEHIQVHIRVFMEVFTCKQHSPTPNSRHNGLVCVFAQNVACCGAGSRPELSKGGMQRRHRVRGGLVGMNEKVGEKKRKI
jgi:hypothetical protein